MNTDIMNVLIPSSIELLLLLLLFYIFKNVQIPSKLNLSEYLKAWRYEYRQIYRFSIKHNYSLL
jgi:hypothetical protein